MPKPSSTNHNGFLHLPIVVLVLVVCAVSLVFLGIQQQGSQVRTDTATAKIRKQRSFAAEDLSRFRYATESYFKDGETYQSASCKPKDVKVKYYNGHRLPKDDHRRTVGGYAAYWGAFRYQPDYSLMKPNKKIPGSAYCKIYINRDEIFPLPGSGYTKQGVCILFMHEYGHLLGREHDNNDPTSVMYQGHANENISAGKRYNRIIKWNENLEAKSLCAESWFQNRPT